MIPWLSAHSDSPRVDGIKMAVNYGGNKTRFIAPVRSGKRIRGHWKLLEMAEKRPGQWQQTVEITIEIEGEDKPALICEWMTPFFVASTKRCSPRKRGPRGHAPPKPYDPPP